MTKLNLISLSMMDLTKCRRKSKNFGWFTV